MLEAAPANAGEVLVAAAGLQYWGSDLGVEAIRFAGTNRLKVEFTYNGSHRVVEPYSLRRATGTGNLLLYGWQDGAEHIKAFKVGEMVGVRATGIPFTPRYRVEFAASGPVDLASAVPTSHRSPSGAPPSFTTSRRRSGRSRRATGGPIYVYECTRCSRRFHRKNRSSTLRPHKDQSGYRCPGRHARYVDIRR
jgi:DNA-directed RNA polymerase subunit RPC12/RpoP